MDFSAVAVSQARQLADRLGRAALFRVGDLAPQSFHDEAVRSIQHHDRRRRVFGTATA